ncbi:MAG: hypothetical protein JSU70_02360, partial [Phycisphaerales bacterium]
MCRKLICTFSLILVLGLAGSAFGQESTIINAPEGPPPVIDGVVDEVWSLSDEHFIATHVADGAPDNDADCSGSWWVLMDAEYLYILVDVNDETLTQDNPIGDSWQDDSVEIYIDGDNSKGGSTDGVNDYQYRVRWNDEVEQVTEYFLSPASLVGVEYAVATTIDGYLFEVKLPWATMTGGLPPAGQLLGIDVWINDDDDGGGRDSQMAWSGINGDGWNTPSQWGTAQLTPPVTAFNPSPADGAVGVTAPLMQWTAGRDAAAHDVYFGTNPTPGPAEFIIQQTWTVYWHTPGLIPGMTYYWRIDEIEADTVTIHPGDVWSFTAMPLIAWDPYPPDGSDGVMTDAKLSWTAGQAEPPLRYAVYFGENFDDVNEGTAGADRGILDLVTTFDPGALKPDTAYYWRIDQIELDDTTHRGEVWSFATIESGPGRIMREWWFEVFGTAVANLTIDPRYPDNPDGWEFVDLFEGPVNWSDNYGSRLRGWLFPPGTGDYTFWVAGDDETQLWLSTDDDPGNAKQIASVAGWVPSRDFDNTGGGAGGPSQKSRPQSLVAGQRYYIEAIMKEGTGGDNIAVAWQGPGIAVRDVISAEYVGATPFLPEVAYAPAPGDGSSGVLDTVMLMWQPGVKAVQHEVYFGTDRAAVAAADTATTGIYRGLLSATSYIPTESPLVWAQTYYWKVNEKNNDGTMTLGKVWSFTVADHIVVDDFEDYNDYSPDRIFQTWIDGYGYTEPPPGKAGNGTGSTVGYISAPFAEQTIVHGGGQSMPFGYDNAAFPFYSETEREWLVPQNFSRSGVKAMTLYFYGSAPAFMEDPPGTYKISGGGADIWGTADEFRFVYKQLTGDGEISARVANIGPGSNAWAKAGVMMRDTLDPGSAHMMAVMTGGEGGGTAFQGRQETAGESSSFHGDITASPPHWVKLTRAGNTITAYHSDTGADDDWELFTDETPDGAHTNPIDVVMGATIYVGMAVTSHDAAATRVAEFTDVSTVGSVMGAWQVADIGLEQPAGNSPQAMYVALEDSAGVNKMVPHRSSGATGLSGWNEWNIELAEFAPVNLNSIKKMYIGVGNRLAPSVGGTGDLFIDDIRLYRPRCIPAELTLSEADLNSDCLVDYRDVEIMTGDWLDSAAGLAG